MSMQEPLYMISYDESKQVFNEAMNRFADFYGMTLTEVLASAKCLRPAAFRNELQKYAVRYEKSLEEVMAHEGSHGVTLPAGGRYIVLVKYERDESSFAEKIRETTYHELGHALSLYQTNLRHPDRENAFQNPKDKNTEILLNIGNYVWQEFIAKYLASHLITNDNQRIIFDMRNRTDMFVQLIGTLRVDTEPFVWYEKLTDVFAAALNSSIPFSEYTIPADFGDDLLKRIKTLYGNLYQHCVADADYTISAELTEALGYHTCALLNAARKHS